MIETFFYAFRAKFYCEDDNGKSQEYERRGFLQATWMTDAFEQIRNYYGENELIDIHIYSEDLEGFTEINEDTIPELLKFMDYCKACIDIFNMEK